MPGMKFPNAAALSFLTVATFAFSAPVLATDEAKPAASAPAPVPAAPAPAAAGDMTPDQVVGAYLKALQEQRFSDAYQYTSTTLRAGKGQEEWVKEQQYIMQMGEVKILDFKPRPALIGADGVARVPNVLKSQDKFLNQLGLDEHEIYELLKENGAWKIDQQTLAEGADRDTYFPDEAQKK
jgi:hypothetical protein